MDPGKPDTEAIKRAAHVRATTSNLPYAGALTPSEAHALMQAGARLVDVRTRAELHYVGRVPGSIAIEWQNFPEGVPNADFVPQLGKHVERKDALMFMCRSGARSHSAAVAATQAGYAQCYNVLEGFEGDKDADGHRNMIGGWKKAGLPWTQS